MKTRFLFTILLCSISNAYASCGSSFCSVNTSWDTQGLVNDEGLRIDLRYSYAKADILRGGTSKIAAATANGSGQGEIENMRTINQMINMDLDYAINRKWNIALGLPLVIRDHSHTFDATGSFFTQQSKFNEPGDIRLLGKYKFDSSEHDSGSGITFGLKLPTGAINKTMTPQDPAAAPGTPYALERASQPGTGSTDLILGAHYHHDMSDAPWGWFVSGQVQTALNTRSEYRPGDAFNADLGAHYSLAPSLTGLLQLNAQFRNRDTGINANITSGGHSLNLSPGLSFTVTPGTNLYGLIQIALLQYANIDPALTGTGQLTAPWSLALGISHSY